MTQKKVLLLWLGLSLLTTVGAAQTVTGSGTAQSIPVFSGTYPNTSSTIGGSYITTSGTSVGIALPTGNTPVQRLEVNGAIQADTSLIANIGSLISYGTGGNIGQEAYLYNSTKNGLQGVGYLWAIDNMYQGTTQNPSGYTNSLQFYVYDSNICGSGAQLCKSRLTLMDTGNVGIGTQNPNALLEVNGNAQIDGSLAGSGGGAVSVGTSGIKFPDTSTQTTAWTGVLCGGDYAESVDVTGERTSYMAGDVLVIDSIAPGKFLKSAEPYSTLVTGVYSTDPGVTGRRQKTPKSTDEVPMAMIGIVPTRVSAENGPIRPGDLLVTSSTLGHAMKGTDRERMLGAVVGKALGSLDSGTGTIEVAVILQ